MTPTCPKGNLENLFSLHPTDMKDHCLQNVDATMHSVHFSLFLALNTLESLHFSLLDS